MSVLYFLVTQPFVVLGAVLTVTGIILLTGVRKISDLSRRIEAGNLTNSSASVSQTTKILGLVFFLIGIGLIFVTLVL